MKNPWCINVPQTLPRTAPRGRRPAMRRGVSLIEATVAISLAAFTAVIAAQFMFSSMRGHQLQTQQVQALRELDNALEVAFWLDGSQLKNAMLETVARTTIDAAQEAGTAPDELAIVLTVTDDPEMPPQTKRIDGVVSYREKGSGSTITLPTLSIWRAISTANAEATP